MAIFLYTLCHCISRNFLTLKLQFISAQYSDMLDSVYTLNLIHKGTYSN